MKSSIGLGMAAFIALVGTGAVVRACSLCGGETQRLSTLREDVRFARIVVVGTLHNPRLTPGARGNQGGATDVKIERIFKGKDVLGDQQELVLPRYQPIADPKNPPRYLVFCDVYDGKLDPYRGVPVKGEGLNDYLQAVSKLGEKTDVKTLTFFFDYLDSENPDIARDAFIEFAKANDEIVGEVARGLDPVKLRELLKTAPVERLGLLAFLLGACGGDADAALLKEMIQDGSARTRAALGGLLAGYIALKPDDGWAMVRASLIDPKRRFNEKLSVLYTLRFFRTWKPKESRPRILEAISVVVSEGDLADLGIEDLRRWQWWDLTETILAQYGKESHAEPIVRRSILRYALSCPKPEAVAFVKRVRADEAELIADLEEALAFERGE